ncbi:tetratricopeptide repeat protein [Planococcus lenghuensis]|uniref:Transcriptional regulator n=1 Tax=Planococcus lenghuensis TaxID=2213202 RepID=A0A1Q2KWZ8_9BACL|nr:tetratricopeptide repeat protein [Planococcus lenghuensis]AQQ52656.1 transcriptional regulator [Planococcus lenghuensis]
MENKKKTPKENVVSFIPTGDYYFKKALTALNRSQFDKAQKYLRRAAELSPEDPMILMQYGVILLEIEDFDGALDALLTAHAFDPAETDIYYFLAETYAHLGRFIEARNYATQYVEQDEQGDYIEESLEIIEFAEQEDWQLFDGNEAADSELYHRQEQARRRMEQGHFEEAVEMLEKLIDEEPDFYAAYNNLSLAYFYMGEAEEAEALLHEVLRRNPGNLHALCNLAVVYYYEKNEDLAAVLKLLKKIKPYVFEHRYKLGATFALVGEHQEAFHWLRSLQRRGFEGDPGFYFWLANAAYHTGQPQTARQAWKQLVQMDSSKEGYEPWAEQSETLNMNALEHVRSFLVEKLDHQLRSERLFGLFLLGKSSHKQEIIAHPKWLQTDELSVTETYVLGYTLGHQFNPSNPSEKAFLSFMEVTELLYGLEDMVSEDNRDLFQLWFMLGDKALSQGYAFRNPRAIAAAAYYLSESARSSTGTKKEAASVFGVSVATLTKYADQLIQFLPYYGE